MSSEKNIVEKPINTHNSQNTRDDAGRTSPSLESLHDDVQHLVDLVVLRKKACDDTENETRFLREYVESFISMENTDH